VSLAFLYLNYVGKCLLILGQDGYGGYIKVTMSTVHLHTLRIIHDCKLIAATLNWQRIAYVMKTLNETRGNGIVFST